MCRADMLMSNYPVDSDIANNYHMCTPISHYGYAVRITPDDQDTFIAESLDVTPLRMPVFDLGTQSDLRVYLASHNDIESEPGDDVLCLFIDYGDLPTGGWDGDVLLYPEAPFSVVEGQSYWLVAEVRNPPVGGDGTAFYDWYRSAGEDPYDRIHETLVLSAGGTWSSVVTPAPAFMFHIPVPEPSAGALLALAGAAGLWRRRRRG